MPKQLPSYETLVRWTVKDVVDWLKEAGLGEFKDHITKHNIDGNKLASLSEFDINNFVGKPKKKIELQNHVRGIVKPKNTQSRAWNPPPQKQTSSGSKNGYDSDSDESIYSWGDEFSDDEAGKRDEDDDDDDENYIEPEAGPRRPPPSTPGRRPPQPVPPAAAPLLPGQKIPTARSQKTIPKPPAEEHYEDPDKQTQSKTARRKPPPPPPDSPEPNDQEYFNKEQIDAERMRKGSIPQTTAPPPPIPTPLDDDYIKYNPDNQEIYTEPDDEEEKPGVPAPRNGRPQLPSIPSPPKETNSRARRTTLPPIPTQSSRKTSQTETPARKTSQTETPTRKTSQAETPTRKTSQPETPSRKISQPDQVDGMGSFDWYHNELERAIAEDRLKNYNHDGMFLVRKSLKGGQVHPYTLMVYYKAKVFNFPVRKRTADGKFALGKKESADDIAFDTVDALIQNYQKVNMILQGAKGQGWTAKLTKPLPK